jgi:hypothetical protein
MLGTMAKVRRKSWTAIGVAAALAAIAGLAVACSRKSPIPPPPPPPTKSLPAPDAQPPAEEPTEVLVWMESTPPGAHIVRVSRCQGLGWTPEIVDLQRSNEPVLIRFELDGYIPVTREVSAASDGEVKVELIPSPKKRARAKKK